MSALLGVFEDMTARLSSFGRVVVAGGAVRDHLMGRQAKDYDVFVLAADPAVGDGIATALSDLDAVTPLEWHKSEPFLLATVRVRDVLVQVMWTPVASVEALLESFDWNVCLFAYDGSFHQRAAIDDIAPGKSLRLQKVTFPISTLRRGFRFSERFGMVLERDDVTTICKAVVASSAEEAA